jgi:hypothetical protein
VNGEVGFSRRLAAGARGDFRQAEGPGSKGRLRALEGGIRIE